MIASYVANLAMMNFVNANAKCFKVIKFHTCCFKNIDLNFDKNHLIETVTVNTQ